MANKTEKKKQTKKEKRLGMDTVSSCEYVSIGHPDSTADAITSALLDEYLKKDPNTRYAVECQIKDFTVNLAGEVTSKARFSKSDIETIVKYTIARIGYSEEYARMWPKNATLDASRVTVNQYISKQSPNIAQGVDNDGYGDQGCFVGMATGDNHFGHFTESRWLSQIIGQMLYAKALNGTLKIGLDIKTLVTVKNDMATQVIVAAPMLPKHEKEARKEINEVVRRIIQHPCEIIINGTGAYVVHSSVGDCGMTGRKLAVNFYGTDCPIGGGAVFGKDPTKADVCLNLLARHLARQTVMQKSWDKDMRKPFDHLSNRAIIKIHCCIGRKEIGVSLFDGYGRLMCNESKTIPPSRVIGSLCLRKPIYFDMCLDGLFSKVDALSILDLSALRKRTAKKGKMA